jgi:hypothetical protein
MPTSTSGKYALRNVWEDERDQQQVRKGGPCGQEKKGPGRTRCLAVRISRPAGALILSSASPMSTYADAEPLLLGALLRLLVLPKLLSWLDAAAGVAPLSGSGVGEVAICTLALSKDTRSAPLGGVFGTVFLFIFPLPPLPEER